MRRKAVWAVVALLVAAATAAGILALRDERGVKGPILETDLFAVRADVTPHEHLFGDSLTAQIDVLLDRDFVKPETVRVDGNFAPFQVRGKVRREREDLGNTTHLKFVYDLDCLGGEKCLPKLEGKTFELPEARVSYVVTDIGDRTTTRVRLPLLSGTSRLLGANLDAPAFRADPRQVPAPTYRMSPTLLAAVALGVAGALVLAALVLLVPLAPIGFVQRWRERRRFARRTDLERALAHLRATSPGESEEVRPALERLASELGRVENDDLAVQTRRLAWSEPPPVEGEIGSISDDAEQVIAKGRK
ncbi:MAG: hypothetical protein ACJ75P_12970 [Gaiellaceae bacterium]